MNMYKYIYTIGEVIYALFYFYVRTECTLLGYTNIQKCMSNSSYFFPCFMVDCCILNTRRILIGLTDLIGLEVIRTMWKSRGPYILRQHTPYTHLFFYYVGVVAVN